MSNEQRDNQIKEYFQDKLDRFGTSPRGADWNSPEAQNLRFDQLLKVIDQPSNFTVLDYGCGYGALANYMLENGLRYTRYYGYDILPSAIETARSIYADSTALLHFTTELESLQRVDFAVASGVFNIRLDSPYQIWTEYVIEKLTYLNDMTKRGFSSNFLTKYSDADRMKPQLYYADPCYLFDYCKRHFSRNVAILHDYDLYDFTLIVRKNG